MDKLVFEGIVPGSPPSGYPANSKWRLIVQSYDISCKVELLDDDNRPYWHRPHDDDHDSLANKLVYLAMTGVIPKVEAA